MRHALLCSAVLLSLGGCSSEEPREPLSLAQGCVEELAPEQGTLLILEELGPPVLTEVDLTTGESSTAFSVPSSGFAYELDSRGADVVLAYTPPPEKGGAGYDRSGLARIDGQGVELLGASPSQGSWAFYPAWEPDGRGVWFVRAGGDLTSHSMLARYDVASGSVTDVRPDATEPAVSPSGGRLAWVDVDPVSGARQLMVGDGYAQDPLVLVGTELGDLGQPFFSADGAWVYFIVLLLEESNWLLDLLVPSAHAHASHNTPGDWWRVPVDGGDAERVTWLETILYDGAPGTHADTFVSATREGVVLVDRRTGDTSMLRCTRTARAVALR